MGLIPLSDADKEIRLRSGKSRSEIEADQALILALRKRITEVWLLERYEGDRYAPLSWIAYLSTIVVFCGFRIGWARDILSGQVAYYLIGAILVGFACYRFVSGIYLLALAVERDRNMHLTHYAIMRGFRSNLLKVYDGIIFLMMMTIALDYGYGQYQVDAMFVSYAVAVCSEFAAKKAANKELMRIKEDMSF